MSYYMYTTGPSYCTTGLSYCTTGLNYCTTGLSYCTTGLSYCTTGLSYCTAGLSYIINRYIIAAFSKKLEQQEQNVEIRPQSCVTQEGAQCTHSKQ